MLPFAPDMFASAAFETDWLGFARARSMRGTAATMTTFAGLPACTAATHGDEAVVYDATHDSPSVTFAGGGNYVAVGRCNGARTVPRWEALPDPPVYWLGLGGTAFVRTITNAALASHGFFPGEVELDTGVGTCAQRQAASGVEPIGFDGYVTVYALAVLTSNGGTDGAYSQSRFVGWANLEHTTGTPNSLITTSTLQNLDQAIGWWFDAGVVYGAAVRDGTVTLDQIVDLAAVGYPVGGYQNSNMSLMLRFSASGTYAATGRWAFGWKQGNPTHTLTSAWSIKNAVNITTATQPDLAGPNQAMYPTLALCDDVGVAVDLGLRFIGFSMSDSTRQ